MQHHVLLDDLTFKQTARNPEEEAANIGLQSLLSPVGNIYAATSGSHDLGTSYVGDDLVDHNGVTAGKRLHLFDQYVVAATL